MVRLAQGLPIPGAIPEQRAGRSYPRRVAAVDGLLQLVRDDVIDHLGGDGGPAFLLAVDAQRVRTQVAVAGLGPCARVTALVRSAAPVIAGDLVGFAVLLAVAGLLDQSAASGLATDRLGTTRHGYLE